MYWLIAKFLAERRSNRNLAFLARTSVGDILAYKLAKITKGFIIDSLTFKYRRKITITEQSGNDLTDYQVRIDLDATNFDFSHFLNEGKDLRFTDASKNLLPYWVEKMDIAAEKATIWVKVPSIPANSSASIYMYYGNDSLPSASDGEATFLFFDDFKPTNNYVAFGVFNDVHACDQCDNPSADRYCTEWKNKMDLVISKFNEMLFKGLKFVVSNGDFTDEDGCADACTETKDQAVATLQQQVQQLNDLQAELYYCIGNHELFMLTKDEFMGYVGMENKYYYVDIGDNFRIIILDAQYNPSTNEDRGVEDYSVGHIPPEELDWLENVALNTTRKCIVFCHQLLCAGGGFDSGFYVDNAADVRAILENAGNVIAVINSHLHKNYFEVTNGIPYFVTEAHVDGSGLEKASYAIFWAFDNGAVGMLGERGMDSRVPPVSSPDSNKWVVDAGSWRVAGIIQGIPTDSYAWIHSLDSFSSNIAIRLKQQVSASYTSFMWRFQDTDNYYYYHSVNDQIKKRIGGSVSTIATTTAVDESLIHTFELRLLGTSMEILCDDDSIGSADDGDLPTSGAIGFLTYTGGYGVQAEVCIRKLVSPEPAVSIGSEETA